MEQKLVKLICDIPIIPERRIVRAGANVRVVREFAGETYQGLPTLLVMHDSVADLLDDGFFARGWEYTTDLSADVQLLQAARIENKIQNGLDAWRAAPERVLSVESDCGAWWTLHGSRHEQPHYTVSWVHATGELYAWNRQQDQFLILTKIEPHDAARLEFLIEGWASPDSDIFHDLTALVEQIQARANERTPQRFVIAFAPGQRW